MRRLLSRWIVVAVVVAVSAVSLALAFAGNSIWPTAAIIWALATAVLAPCTGYALALAGSFAGLLAVETMLLRIGPVLHLGLDALSDFTGSAGVVLLLVVFIVRQGELKIPSRESLRIAGAALAPPVLGGLAAASVAVATSSRVVAWSMRNDAAWTEVSAQHIIADGGVNTAAHPNPSPLMSALMAVSAAPGRAALTGAAVLRSDVVRAGQLWVLVILATSLFVGLLVARSVDPGRPRLRLVAAFIAGFLPFSWYVSGFATHFGFYSASLATVLLVVAWVVWRGAGAHPILSVGFMLLECTDLLATWAILVVVPASLIVMMVLRYVRAARLRSSALRIAWLCVAAGQVVVYGALFSIPDLGSQGEALSSGGGIQPVSPLVFVGLAIMAIVSAALVRDADGSRSAMAGAVAVVVGVTVALTALLVTGHGAGWSYYPTKLAWLTTILLMVILFEAVAGYPGKSTVPARAAKTVSILALVGLFAVAVAVHPPSKSILAISPITDAVSNSSVIDDAYAATLFDVSRPGRKILLSKYGTQAADNFANLWLLQSASAQSADPVRSYAYYLASTNAGQVCDAIRAWRGGVDVLTTRPGWGTQLHLACPHERFSVTVTR